MNSYPENGQVGKHLLMLKQRSQQRRQTLKLLLIVFGWMLLALVVFLSGCATHLPVPCEPLPLISMPVPPKSLPSVSYSLEVQTWLEGLQQKLTGGPSKP
jgi:hypothetical protein